MSYINKPDSENCGCHTQSSALGDKSVYSKPPLDPQALADCLRQLPKDSLEAESASDQRLMDQWGSSKNGR